jgi:DNA oxidative demethylase
MTTTRLAEAADPVPPDGFRLVPAYLGPDEQRALLADIRAVVRTAPFFRPAMPGSGRPFSVRMTNAGPLGWVSDKSGYRYQPTHPVTGLAWPAIPERLLAIWADLAVWDGPPECSLVNFYEGAGARMGLHRDEDEEEMAAPVVSLSLGDTAVFRIGGQARRGPTRSVRLASGDAVVLAGAARTAYHGIDRVLPGTSTLLEGGGRINLTLRRVTGT